MISLPDSTTDLGPLCFNPDFSSDPIHLQSVSDQPSGPGCPGCFSRARGPLARALARFWSSGDAQNAIATSPANTAALPTLPNPLGWMTYWKSGVT